MSELYEDANEDNTCSTANSSSVTNSILLCPKHNREHISYDACESSDEEYETVANSEFDPIGSWGLYGIINKAWCEKYRPVIKLISYDDLQLTPLEKAGYLTDRIIASCSSYLEKCPINRKLVLCKCMLSNKILKNVELLQYHSFLQFLDLSFNYLEDITVLQHLPYLMYLDVSNNNLSNLLNFKAPHNLTYVNYAFNQIKDIPDLTNFWAIKYLYLQHNKIFKISGLENLRYLETLDISHNEIEVIENLDNLNIFNLYLQNNRICNFVCDDQKGFKTMPYLSYVRLGNNELQSLKMFECAVLVQSIEIQNNEISNLMEVSYLSNLQILSSLNLDRNPIRNQENYEPVCLSMTKNLKFLDGEPVNVLQKAHAQVAIQPNINLQAVKIHDDLLSISHLSKFANMGLDVIPADRRPRPLVMLVGPLCCKHEELLCSFEQQFGHRVIKLKNYIDREMRPGESSDSYYFVTKEEFGQKLLNGEFLMVFNVLQNYCGLSQDEYARGLKEIHKVMIINADIKAALAFRMRGFRPTLVLAMPESEDIHRDWIANDVFDFPTYNKRIPNAAVRVTPRESQPDSSVVSDISVLEVDAIYLNLENENKEQAILGEDDTSHYNAYHFLQSCPEDYYSECSKFNLSLDKLTGKAEDTSNVNCYPMSYNIFDKESSINCSYNLIHKFETSILRSRKFYLDFHNSHPGLFYTTIYTDYIKKAIKELKKVTKTAMMNYLEDEAVDTNSLMENHSVTCGRLRLHDTDMKTS